MLLDTGSGIGCFLTPEEMQLDELQLPQELLAHAPPPQELSQQEVGQHPLPPLNPP
jgi:hypothetical protein